MTRRKTKAQRELERENNRLRWRAKRDKYNAARRLKRRIGKPGHWGKKLMAESLKQTWANKFMASASAGASPDVIERERQAFALKIANLEAPKLVWPAHPWTVKPTAPGSASLTASTVASPTPLFDQFEAPCVLLQLEGPPIMAWRRGDGTLREMPADEIIRLLKNAREDS